jgi:hypothetical protein
MQHGDVITISNSDLTDDKKKEIIGNTDELCEYILETYILNAKQSKGTSERWIPKPKTQKEIQLSHIIATSELVSYIFEYKLMPVKAKNAYLKKAEEIVEDIYNNLINNDRLYKEIKLHIEENINEEKLIKYNNELLSPRTVFVLVISIIQEVVRRTLTQSRNNIFNYINKQSRDKGLDEKSIMDKVKKDATSYIKIIHYFEKPVSATIKKKKDQLNIWLEELNKLRIGVLDEYLFNLAEATQISFEEITQTSISIKKLN